jgi:hypothetical protein
MSGLIPSAQPCISCRAFEPQRRSLAAETRVHSAERKSMRTLEVGILSQVPHAVILHRQYLKVKVEPKQNRCMNVEKPWLNSFGERISARRALACVSMQCELPDTMRKFRPRSAIQVPAIWSTARSRLSAIPMTHGHEPMKRQKGDAQESVASL